MHWRTRQRVLTIFAILAVVAVGAKFIKAIYRGEAIQSRVQPIR